MEIEVIKHKCIKAGDRVMTQENYTKGRDSFFTVDERDIAELNPDILWVRKKYEPIPSYIMEEERGVKNDLTTPELFGTVFYWITAIILWTTYWWVAGVLWEIKEMTDSIFSNPVLTCVPVLTILVFYVHFIVKFLSRVKKKLV